MKRSTGFLERQSIFPHGHTKYGNQPYVRTQPSVLREIESASASAPSRIYQTMVTAGAAHVNQTTAVPRNPEQVRNTLKHQRNRGRISRDALFNLHELALDSNFIQHITTYPDLKCKIINISYELSYFYCYLRFEC